MSLLDRLHAWLFPAPAPRPPAPVRQLDLESVRAALLAAHNRERGPGREPLARSAALEAAALTHARDMARQGRLSHMGSDGSYPADRMRNAGYAGGATGENVASGATVEVVMTLWMADPAHRANVLGHYTAAGFGTAAGAGGVTYWCADFGG